MKSCKLRSFNRKIFSELRTKFLSAFWFFVGIYPKITMPFFFPFQNVYFLELKPIELTYINEMCGLNLPNYIETQQK